MKTDLTIPMLADTEISSYLPVMLILLMAISFAVINLIITNVLGPRREGKVKGQTYESGMNPIGTARKRFNVRFYLIAMVFLVFDVEIIFLYPFVTVMRELSVAGLVLMGVFLLVLLVPFAYLLSTGALEWGPVKQVVSRAGAGVLRAAGMPGRSGLDPAVRELPEDAEQAA